MLSRFSLAALIVASIPAAYGISTGAPDSVSGAPGESTCTACHGGNANSGPGRVRIDAGAASYTPGQKMRMKVIIEDPDAMRWGFQLSTRLESNQNASAGTLAPVNDQTQILKASVLEWITHTSSGTRRGTRSPVEFEFDWMPPANDAGPVVFYAAANAANGNGTNTGDRIYTTNTRLPAAAGQSRPAFSSEGVSDAYTGRRGIAPGAWVNLAGTDLAAREAHWTPVAGKPFETQVAGVTVKVNDVPAAIAFASPSRILFLAPANTPEGNVPVVVERDGQASQPAMVQSATALPAIYALPEPDSDPRRFFASVTAAGAGTALALISPRGWVFGKPSVDSRATRGVLPGEEIDIYAIGLGRIEGEFPADRLFTGNFRLANTPAVRFGQTAVQASQAVLISPGLYAVRVRVPESLSAGDVPLTLEVGGIASAPNVFLTVQAP